jgi:hypothetical protein
MTSGDHNWAFGGTANLSGSFYNPNFLSYSANLYLNQSRANSNFQSISDASGVDLSANIFGGSHFPGSVSYSKAYNSEGNYDVPGLTNFVTHGNSDTFGINWSENVPAMPSLSAGFQFGTSQYSVYGVNDQGTNAFHSFNLRSGYQMAGFNMGAFYTEGGGHSLIPQVVAGEQGTQTQSTSDGYGFNVAHQLPWHGSISTSINRSDWNSEFLSSNTSGSIDMITSLASVHPTSKLTLSGSENYSDNLSGQLIASVIAAGGGVQGINSNESSSSLDLMGIANYTPVDNVQTSAYFERRTQLFLGEDYGVDSFGGSATYSHVVLNGNFIASMTASANRSDQTNDDSLSFSTNENYSSEIRGWHVNGTFGYAQNAQTLLVTYMNSFYHYSGNVSHRWGQFRVSAGAGGGRTALTQQAGTASSNESFNGSLSYIRWFTATGSYSKSSGQALLTGAGLVPVPVPLPVLPSSLVNLYGGDSYSAAVSSSPVRGFLFTASYAKSNSNTSSSGFMSTNENDQYNALIQYQVRKLNFTSGYSRLEQGFSSSGTPPEVISSYYMGVSRWFNFF